MGTARRKGEFHTRDARPLHGVDGAANEALVVDHTYTAKALAGMLAWIREGRVPPTACTLFWHTGGQTGLFAS